MKKKWDVIVVGNSFLDFIFTGLPGWPGPGEEVFAQAMRRDMGGATIIASGLGRLGRKVALLTCVGDVDHAWFNRNLEGSHVDTSLVHTSDKPTAVTFSVPTTEDRSLFSCSGADADLPILLERKDARDALFHASLVHFAMTPHLQAPTLFAELRAARCLISLDAGGDKVWMQDRGICKLLQQTDFFLPNEKEAQLISGRQQPKEILQWFETFGSRCTVVKRGGHGSVMQMDGVSYEEPPVAVDLVDTTGAGDSFDAGFIHSMLSGDQPQEWLRLGNLCGALSTRAAGGIAAFPTLEEVGAIRCAR